MQIPLIEELVAAVVYAAVRLYAIRTVQYRDLVAIPDVRDGMWVRAKMREVYGWPSDA